MKYFCELYLNITLLENLLDVGDITFGFMIDSMVPHLTRRSRNISRTTDLFFMFTDEIFTWYVFVPTYLILPDLIPYSTRKSWKSSGFDVDASSATRKSWGWIINNKMDFLLSLNEYVDFIVVTSQLIRRSWGLFTKLTISSIFDSEVMEVFVYSCIVLTTWVFLTCDSEVVRKNERLFILPNNL